MKLTLNGALDLSRSINSQTIWNKRSTDYFNELAKELKQDSLNALENKLLLDLRQVEVIKTQVQLEEVSLLLN